MSNKLKLIKKKYILKKKLSFFLKFNLYYGNNISQTFKKQQRSKNNYFFNRFRMLESMRRTKMVYRNHVKKNYFINKTFLIKIISTNRNLFVGVFSLDNKLQFLMSMGSITNFNLKRKSLHACNILLKSLLSRKLYHKYLLKLKYRFIFIFMGSGKFYKFAYQSLINNKIKSPLLIQKINFPHNGCFKKKKRRR